MEISEKTRNAIKSKIYYETDFGNNRWDIHPKCISDHPAPFPVEIQYRLIKLHSFINDIVIDIFFGSGTTAIACEKLNRRWIGIEKNEKYCEIAKQRIESETSQMKLF